MTESLYSTCWYRVKDLKPRLRSHARIHRHHYRGQLSYVLENQLSGRFYRFDPNAYALVGLLDGRRTLQGIWNHVGDTLGDAGPTQDETIQLLGQLHAADLLQCDVPPDVWEIAQRSEKEHRREWRRHLSSPLFWRVALFDPEPLLQRLRPLIRPVFTRFAFFIWLGVVGSALLLFCMHWTDLTENIAGRLLEPRNLLLLWLLLPVLKALHELGHALCVNAFGGEVHEMGILFLVLVPLPYVDASSASAFRDKGERILVSAAGMMVELFVASLALLLWLNIEPGFVRASLYNVLFLAGVSTLAFNGNPLLRFDGYYILSDLIEIPNLRSRSSRYLKYIVERYAFGSVATKPPCSTVGERVWFCAYGVSSFMYRIMILSAIVLFIAGKFFFLGVVLAVWGIGAWGVYPLMNAIRHVATSPRLRPVRKRAVTLTAGSLAGAIGLICLLPVPLSTVTEGVISVPEEAIVRAGAEGFIVRTAVAPGTRVERGDRLFVCQDPTLEANIASLEAEVSELRARKDEVWLEDRVEAAIYQEEIAYRTERLRETRQRLDALSPRSAIDGIFVVPEAQDLPGRFARQGDTLAYILRPGAVTARVVVSQADVGLVRHQTRKVQLRPVEAPNQLISASVLREVPAASKVLPSAALGILGGGKIPTDPGDAEGVSSVYNVFEFELELAGDTALYVGGRVLARFDHGWEPLAARLYRGVRRLFLSRFHV